MPQTYNGETATKDHILSRGLGHLLIPVDCGSFRRLKVRSEGCRENAYCIDAVFHPCLLELFQDGAFCNSMETFRPFLTNVAFNHVEKELDLKLSREVKLITDCWYKDPDDRGIPRVLSDLPTATLGGEEFPPVKKKEEPLIQELQTGGQTKTKTEPVIQKGFLAKKSSKALYPEGSNEGVLPENAGDQYGWLPKNLRKTCKIVDTRSEEYQKSEQQSKHAKEQNELKNMVTRDLDKWTQAKIRDDRWAQDDPAGKYSVDYSRFERIAEDEDTAQPRLSPLLNEDASKLLEETAKEFESFEKGFLKSKTAKDKPKPPVHRLTPGETVTLEVDVPGLNSMRDVDLEVTAEVCSLRFPCDLGPLTVSWRVNPDTVTAKFSKKKQQIVISADAS